jgi:hypothetical protein
MLIYQLSFLLAFVMLILSLFAQVAAAQELKEGKIVYQIEYKDLPAQFKEIEGIEAMLAQEMNMFFKGQMSRMELSMMGTNAISIFDGKTNQSTSLLELMGNKYAVEKKPEDEEQENKIEVVSTSEKKKIAGYECNKSILNITEKKTGEKYELEVWSSPSIGSAHMYSKHIKGFPLSFELRNNGITMRISAKEIVADKVSDKLFKVPDDYKKVNQEELMKMLGGFPRN